MSRCPAEYLEKGCCCTNITVTYNPSIVDAQTYSLIYINRRALTMQHYQCGRTIDPTGHQGEYHDDNGNEEQVVYSTGGSVPPGSVPYPYQKSIRAQMTDYPGVDQRPCRAFGFFESCPNCNELHTQWQRFEVCAIGILPSGKKGNLGCAYYGHKCEFSYEKGKPFFCDLRLCCSTCKITRYGKGIAIPPETP
jgi:hypothetical protein